jgi:hypothetical protein
MQGPCEHGNECSASIEQFLDQLSEYWLLKKDSATWSCVLKHILEVYKNTSMYRGSV